MTPEQIAFALSRTKPFGRLDEQPLKALAAVAVSRTYRRGQFVFQQGDPGDAMYVVVKGALKVLVTSPDGGEVLFCTLEADECFGELSFLDGQARSATVETLSAVELVVLTRASLDAAMRAEPAIAQAMLVFLCDMVRRLTEQAADLVFLDLEGRLAKCLDRLAEEKGIVEKAGIRLDLNITQSDLANMVGASRPSVNQALQAFARRGFIATEARSILITDMAGLRRRYQR